MKNTYSERIANAINEFFKANDWHFDFDQEKGIFDYDVRIDSKLRSTHCVIKVKRDFFLVYALSPINADNRDHETMNAVSEFICRANYGMVNGNFELDFRDGEIRYKVYARYPDNEALSDEILEYTIFCPCNQLETYSDGLLGVMFGGMSAKDAVEMCEGKRLQSLLNSTSSDHADSDDNDEVADGDINFELFDEGGNE